MSGGASANPALRLSSQPIGARVANRSRRTDTVEYEKGDCVQ
jgi:hypothetical protein